MLKDTKLCVSILFKQIFNKGNRQKSLMQLNKTVVLKQELASYQNKKTSRRTFQ
ncbi:hypothetical protein HMPREF1885_00364 [Streptococcus agalactiae]|nr:hypothetical protein SAG0021_04515 [Streptococcus agalactiae FSL S3-277]EPT40508.1 hypothetical protein SAG0030_05210 [Streptococcus agalactiae FSL S3-603]EPT87397.1 hypothetical protein SAG0102_03015 [Streptococcus agalactiae BSU188]EPT89295.1 hypothetical protein SAG0097_06400 [Streptococcus agalactiae BSU442]EPU61629.1 hypothetical protein SAG0304_08480 [Streptococcus agalactiae GB00018]EPU77451.1 hypothetical protein SAG0313_02015 [Streptococcus agalactiae GB00174]EPU79667.1 hypothetic